MKRTNSPSLASNSVQQKAGGASLFWPTAILYLTVIGLILVIPDTVSQVFTKVQGFIITRFSSAILLAASTSILFCVWLACSRYAHIKMGDDDEKPEFSFSAWISMLFCTSLGTGFVIFGTAEPLIHLFGAPTVLDMGQGGKATAIPEAIRLGVVHWGLFAFPLFACGGWAIGYAAYRHNKPVRTSTGLYGLLGERCNDTFFSKVVDTLACVSTVGGVAMMIGLGVASIDYAFGILFGLTLGDTAKLGIMLCFIVIYTISTATGLAKGLRYLSESTGILAFILLVAVLFIGPAPFTYIINILMQVTGEFIWRIPQTLFWTDAGQLKPSPWFGEWTVFYILWNSSYIAFTGGVVARISRGRTLREFVLGVSFVPVLLCILWFGIWGAAACFTQVDGLLDLHRVVQNKPEQGLYLLLGTFPFSYILSFMAFVCFVLFAVTTADSASFFLAQQTTPGTSAPGLRRRVFWGCIIGLTGIIFQLTGGFSAVKSLVIVMASPFIFVLFAYIVSIVKMLRADYPTMEKVKPACSCQVARQTAEDDMAKAYTYKS